MVTYSKYAGFGNVGNPDFDWSLYEDGWNGTSLKGNKKVKTKNTSEKLKICFLPAKERKRVHGF